jgi:hypothetical protein
MTDADFERRLQAFIRWQPFKPFAVELARGARFTVDHAEAMARRGAVAVYIDRDGNYTLFDAAAVTQLTEARGNGGKLPRRRK